GKRLAYLKHYSMKLERAIESCDLQGGQTRTIWPDRQVKSFCWTPQGKIIAALSDPDPDPAAGPAHSDLWEVEVRNSQAVSAPRRLTNFAGFTPFSLSVTADGKKLA